MLYARNIVFWVLLILYTMFCYVFVFLPMTFFPSRARHRMGLAWPRGFLWLLEHVIGLKYRVVGAENIPQGPCVVASKHQSAYETLTLQMFLPHMVFVMKKSLLYLPLVGHGLWLMDEISIDRAKKGEANRKLIEQGADRRDKGYWITIFPEGHRIAPGEAGSYKRGAARMALGLKMDVLPVSHNSGEFWPRNAFLKRPGVATFVVGPAIKADGGWDERALTEEIEDAVESCQKLITFKKSIDEAAIQAHWAERKKARGPKKALEGKEDSARRGDAPAPGETPNETPSEAVRAS